MSRSDRTTFERGARLTPADLRAAGERLFGRWGWQTRLARYLEVDGSTVRRWIAGAVAVPPTAKIALRLLLEREGIRLDAPAPERPPLAPDGVAAGAKRPARPRTPRRG